MSPTGPLISKPGSTGLALKSHYCLSSPKHCKTRLLSSNTATFVSGLSTQQVTLLEGSNQASNSLQNTIECRNMQEYMPSAECRIEGQHTVTASNLFKYCEPCHGLVLFKHHHPLEFDPQQVAELLSTASEWFRAAQQAHIKARYPYFLWNCQPRAGASQFHGHAQVMLSKVCA